MNNDAFSQDTHSQFVLSYELLHLLQWLGRYDVDKLKKIIAKAITHGLHDEIQRMDKASEQNLLQDMHHSMIDFFALLDLNDGGLDSRGVVDRCQIFQADV